jgi:teichuronic acid biosynthesis glycosyltransferase TuaH
VRPSELVRGWDDMVVLVAATSWDGVWMSERHLALQLSRTVPILWVDPQISLLSPLKNPYEGDTLRQPRLRQVAPDILRLTPVTVPGHTRDGLRRIARVHTRHIVRRCVRRLGVPVRATVVASLADMLDVVPAGRTLLYGTDDWSAGAGLMGLDRGWVAATERSQVTRADTVVAISPRLRDKWLALRPDVELVPNGCDAVALAGTDTAPLPGDVRLPSPVAGFVGHLSDRIDLDHLEAVADRGISLLLVGPRQPTFEIARIDALLSRPNVQWVGPKPFAQLPSYLRVIDVGLTPYARSDFNLASFPLKTLEYLAAGRPVVATDLPATRWLDTDLIAVAQGPDEFAAAVAEALAGGRTDADVERRRAFAARHSWARRAEQVAALLALTASTGAGTTKVRTT